MSEIIVKTQKQLDAIKDDFKGEIYIEGGTYEEPLELMRKFKNAYVVSRGQAFMNLGGDAEVREMWGSSQVREMWESSRVGVMRGSSQVGVMWESSQVGVMRGSSQVGVMRGSSQVGVMWGSSQVGVMRESSQVGVMWESSQVGEMWESSRVGVMRGSSQVGVMWGSSQVGVMLESSQVREMWGSSQVKLYGEAMVSAYSAKSIECHGYNVVRIMDGRKKDVTVKINKDSHLIIIPKFEATVEEYVKRCPVEVKRKKATLYKAVHKKGGKYISDYDRSFEYEIGETMEHKNDESKDNSCSYGLHVSHKSWAVSFGSSWDDMALLECEVPLDSIVVSEDCDGKVRTSKLKVIREVPEDEYYS